MGDGAEDLERRAEREQEEEGIIDADVEEDNLPVVRQGGMLLQGTSAPAQLAHAMAVATALADVIDKQQLYKNISGKKHVLVEGWELLGSLLGVFPVVEWTKPVVNGWEARVVAKTLDGAEVGSAEMMCTRDETRWNSADDYAIRSMAQTRAISKALRGPLGFVMKLAGYEPTPEGEIPKEPEPPKPFDPETDLLPGAITGEDAQKQIFAALMQFDPTADWNVVLDQLAENGSWKSLEGEEYKDFLRRLSNLVRWIEQKVPSGDFPPVEQAILEEGFAFAFSGEVVEIAYKEVEKPIISAEEGKKIDEALAKEDVPFDPPE